MRRAAGACALCADICAAKSKRKPQSAPRYLIYSVLQGKVPVKISLSHSPCAQAEQGMAFSHELFEIDHRHEVGCRKHEKKAARPRGYAAFLTKEALDCCASSL